jgi:DNA oxidative demethylase
MKKLWPETQSEPVPECFHLPGFLREVYRLETIRAVRTLDKGWEFPRTKGGFEFSVKVACFGSRWTASGYLPAKVPIPPGLIYLAKTAVNLVTDRFRDFEPHTAICNWYAPDARLGLHVDSQESPALILRGSPIVTFSIGDDARFQICETEEKKKPISFRVQSGDAVIMFGRARSLPHGIDRIYPGTDETKSFGKPGRLSITIRQVHP